MYSVLLYQDAQAHTRNKVSVSSRRVLPLPPFPRSFCLARSYPATHQHLVPRLPHLSFSLQPRPLHVPALPLDGLVRRELDRPVGNANEREQRALVETADAFARVDFGEAV